MKRETIKKTKPNYPSLIHGVAIREVWEVRPSREEAIQQHLTLCPPSYVSSVGIGEPEPPPSAKRVEEVTKFIDDILDGGVFVTNRKTHIMAIFKDGYYRDILDRHNLLKLERMIGGNA